MSLKPDLTIEQLLTRFPHGFAVSPSGKIFEILKQAKEPMDLPVLFERPGGFLAVCTPVLKEEDEVFFNEP